MAEAQWGCPTRPSKWDAPHREAKPAPRERVPWFYKRDNRWFQQWPMREPESHLATVVAQRRFGDTEKESRCHQEAIYSGQVFAA